MMIAVDGRLEDDISVYISVRYNINQLLGTMSTLVINTTRTYVICVRSYGIGTDHRANSYRAWPDVRDLCTPRCETHRPCKVYAFAHTQRNKHGTTQHDATKHDTRAHQSIVDRSTQYNTSHSAYLVEVLPEWMRMTHGCYHKVECGVWPLLLPLVTRVASDFLNEANHALGH